MKSKFLAVVLGLLMVCGVTGAPTSSWSQQNSAMQDLIDGIVQDVIGRTVEAAEKTIRDNTGIDLSEGGYNRSRTYEPLPSGASDESRRELQKLQDEHDRKLAKLDDELRRKLEKSEAEFRREAAKEDKSEKVEEKRVKFEGKINKAYDKFDEKVTDENDRFDEKREKILSKERGN